MQEQAGKKTVPPDKARLYLQERPRPEHKAQTHARNQPAPKYPLYCLPLGPPGDSSAFLTRPPEKGTRVEQSAPQRLMGPAAKAGVQGPRIKVMPKDAREVDGGNNGGVI